MAGTEVSAVLVDVTPYTFGTSALGELDDDLYPYRYFPIIPKNTPIPVRRSEVFYTAVDGQTRVDVKIYQGENVDALLPVLQTYLGHSSIGDTAYYLHLTAESYPDITARVKQTLGDVVPPPVTGGEDRGD